MSGPRTFKISDNSSITAPPFAVKEWTDVAMLVFDFTSWLGPDQYLGMASDVLFQTSPQTQAGVWTPFPGCCQDSQAPLPDDVNPLTLQALTVIPGNKVELSVGNGTPGLAYLASFIVSAGPYDRRKEVGVVMTCFALRPFTGVVLPPPGPVIAVGGTTTLPVGSHGTVNINNTTGNVITITLPATPVMDQTLIFKDIAGNASTRAITIHAAGTTIDGQPDFFMFQDFQAVEMNYTGTGWGVR